MTNPPIDPLRESIVMSLQTCLGAETNVFAPSARDAHRIILSSPVLSASKMQQLETLDDPAFKMARIDLNYDRTLELSDAIVAICEEVADKIRSGNTLMQLVCIRIWHMM